MSEDFILTLLRLEMCESYKQELENSDEDEEEDPNEEESKHSSNKKISSYSKKISKNFKKEVVSVTSRPGKYYTKNKKPADKKRTLSSKEKRGVQRPELGEDIWSIIDIQRIYIDL